VFHPARLRIDLAVLFLVHGQNVSLMIEKEATTAGRALVNGGDGFGHKELLEKMALVRDADGPIRLLINSLRIGTTFYLIPDYCLDPGVRRGDDL
jgi:hypothetical protein